MVKDTRCYVVTGDREKGPFSLKALRAAVQDASLAASTLVRVEDEVERRPLHQLLAELKEREIEISRSRARRREEGDEEEAKMNAARREREDQDRHIEWMAGFIRNHWLLFCGACVVAVVTVAPAGPNAMAQAAGRVIFNGIIGGLVLRWWLNGLRSWSSGWRMWFLIWSAFNVVAMILLYNSRLGSGLLGIVVSVVWAGYTYAFLFNSVVASEFKRREAAGRRDPP